jgi:hypothetical protein
MHQNIHQKAHYNLVVDEPYNSELKCKWMVGNFGT